VDPIKITDALRKVTGNWANQRSREYRSRSSSLERKDALTRIHTVTIREIAFECMEEAYLKASSDGTLPAHARQIMYAARGPIQEVTDAPLNDQYFCQHLLPDYLQEQPEQTKDWDVVFDARGHFNEPHTEETVPLGTLDVRDYLEDVDNHDHDGKLDLDLDFDQSKLYPTRGPRHRFGAILFVEKEGFVPLFRAAKLAERYDVAIMSTKGMSVTASRHLVEQVCSEHDIPLLVLHDFDKSGFSIVGTLQRDTRRYEFFHKFRVIDLGLRLKDVQEWHLESEMVAYRRSDPEENLRTNGATDEEIAFLRDAERSTYRQYVGRRVELNAFTSGDLITFIERGLVANGVQKIVPDFETMEDAYRRAVARANVKKLMDEAIENATSMEVPESLESQVRARIEEQPDLSWDAAVNELAENAVEDGDGL
jgi:hypothetical protein